MRGTARRDTRAGISVQGRGIVRSRRVVAHALCKRGCGRTGGDDGPGREEVRVGGGAGDDVLDDTGAGVVAARTAAAA